MQQPSSVTRRNSAAILQYLTLLYLTTVPTALLAGNNHELTNGVSTTIRLFDSDRITENAKVWLTNKRIDSKSHRARRSVQPLGIANSFGGLKNTKNVLTSFRATNLGCTVASDHRLLYRFMKTKTHGGSSNTVDAVTAQTEYLSAPEHGLWQYPARDGRQWLKAIALIYFNISGKPANKVGFGLERLNAGYDLESDTSIDKILQERPLSHPLLYVNAAGITTARIVNTTATKKRA